MTLSAEKHGLLALLILLALLLAFHLVLIQPAITQKRANAARIETLALQFSQFSRAGAGITRLKGEIDGLRTTESGGDFLAAQAPAIAAASLQRDLKAMIEASGGELISSQALPGRAEEAQPRVTIQAELRVDMAALRAALYQLMIHRPLLFTDKIMIQRRNLSPGRRDRAGGLLEIQLEVSAYLAPVDTPRDPGRADS